jgi:hypothetical protein
MALWGHRRRIAVTAFAVLVASSASGCRWLPLQRVDPNEWPARLPATAISDPSAPKAQGTAATPTAWSTEREAALPPLPLTPVSDREALLITRTTPILDSAIVRTQAVRQSVLSPNYEPTIQPEEKASLIDQDSSSSDWSPDPKSNSTSPDFAPIAKPADASAKTELAPSDVETSSKPNDLPAPPNEHLPQCDLPFDPPSLLAGWRDGLEWLRQLAKRLAETEGQDHTTWEVRERLLSWMATQPGSDPSAPASWTTVLSALSASLEPDASLAVPRPAPFEIAELRLCRKVSGFGNFEPLAGEVVKINHSFILYCEMNGLKYEGETSPYRSRMSATVEVCPSAGGTPLWRQALGTAEDVCRNKRRDYYINYRITLPSSVRPGTYQLRLIQRDDIAGSETKREIAFSIKP